MGLYRVLKEIFAPRYGKSTSRKTYKASNYQAALKLKRISRSFMLLLLLAVIVSGSGWFSYFMLKKSDIFQVTSVVIKGNIIIPEQQIIEKAGLNQGINMLNIDLPLIEKNVRGHSWIDEVEVRRLWPSTVEVAVKEYKPLAFINLEKSDKDQLYYVDAKGHVFAPLTAAVDLDFPVLTGSGLTENLDEMRIQKDSLAEQGLMILKLAARGNQILPLQAISEVHVSSEKGLIIYLVDHPFPIYMGTEKINERFNLLVRVLAQLYRQDKVKEIEAIRMDYAEGKILVANIGAS